MPQTVERVALHAHVEASLYEALRQEAIREDRSMSSVVRQVLRSHLTPATKAKG
jgi:hypothetical protein